MPEGIFRAWGRILQGYRLSLSIEITSKCPLSCPGCYAYGDDHRGGEVRLVSLRVGDMVRGWRNGAWVPEPSPIRQ